MVDIRKNSNTVVAFAYFGEMNNPPNERKRTILADTDVSVA